MRGLSFRRYLILLRTVRSRVRFTHEHSRGSLIFFCSRAGCIFAPSLTQTQTLLTQTQTLGRSSRSGLDAAPKKSYGMRAVGYSASFLRPSGRGRRGHAAGSRSHRQALLNLLAAVPAAPQPLRRVVARLSVSWRELRPYLRSRPREGRRHVG